MVFLYVLLLIVAYLLGSIPSSVWIGKKFYGVDVREHGSHNAGATNTLRVLGKKAALPVFSIDVAKGYAAASLACIPYYVQPELDVSILYLQIAFSLGAVIGHMFPIFAGFKGGKGVATITGAMLAIAPMALICSLLTFFIILYAFHYVSLASMTGGVLFPFYLRFCFGADFELVIFGIIIAILLIFTHRKNITRLIQGVESKTYIIKKDKENNEK